MLTFWLSIAAVVIVAMVAGAIASVAGFGVGSLLTPLLGMLIDFKTAVALVSIPHAIGTALRFFMLRKHVDRKVLWSFGITSAAGGLVGAVLHAYFTSPMLTITLGVLLVFAGMSGLSGLSQRMHFEGWVAWLAGAVSGLLGGLVGNQGGIRSAAMLGFHVRKEAFVATATAVGLMVDGARLPVYLATHADHIAAAWPYVLAATFGTVTGTVAGERLLRQIPEPLFRTIVSGLLLALGLAVLIAAIRG